MSIEHDDEKLATNPAEQASTQCPSTKIVLSGYSQGGQLVHNAANLLASNTAVVNKVAAGESRPSPHLFFVPRSPSPAADPRCLRVVLIYGDPNDGDPVGTIPSSKVKIICHEGDNIVSSFGRQS